MSGQRARGRAAPCAAAILLGAVTAVAAGNVLGAAHPAPAADAAGASAADIRDIRGPKPDWPAWLVPAAVAGAGLIVLSGYGLWRRRRARPARVASPLELAQRRLEALREFMTPADSVRFAVAITAVIREYIEQRFAVGATQLTTEEFLRKVRESSDAALLRQRARLTEFLDQCDIVKFADVRFTRDAMDSLHRSALRFVQESDNREEARDSLPST